MPNTALTLRQLAERNERTFPSYPQVARYFPGRSIEDARMRLGRAIERGDGPALVIGGPGTGKSLLLQVVAEKYQEKYDVLLPMCARLCTRRALLQSILFELGMSYRSRDEGELRLSLLDHLLARDNCPNGLLLLVDEAQTLPVALLDELRVLTNLVCGVSPRVRLVLAGSSSLEECFTDPELESFSQRLSTRCYLGPFSREETTQFIRAQLAASGAAPDNLISADAWPAIFEATDGVPRLVNQLCDRAVSDAVARGHAQIDRQLIQAAWADIQLLPTPWDTPEPSSEAPPSVVEFGSLSNGDIAHVSNDDHFYENDAELDDAIAQATLTEFDTELDTDDAAVDSRVLAVAAAHDGRKTATTPTPSPNPFAENFDEEEVVLDNFAAWDNTFRRNTPRVANSIEPEFAKLVGTAAKSAAKVERKPIGKKANTSAKRELRNDRGGHTVTAIKPVVVTSSADADRPPLRIADVSDASAMASFPMPAMKGEPVLIIEDNSVGPAPPKKPVHRADYRNLFSRLRSR